MSSGQYLYSKYNGSVVIKMVGHIDHRISADLDRFLDTLFADCTIESIIIDLSETVYIDSTSLGILVRIHEQMNLLTRQKTTIISTNPKVTEILHNLSFDQLFVVIDTNVKTNAELISLPHEEASAEDLKKIMLLAHTYLMETSETNRLAFKNVVDILKRG